MTSRLDRWHVGAWTARGTLPGEPLRPGSRRTPDELNFDIVGLARILGRRLSPREELQVRLWQNELRPTHTRLCGVQVLADGSELERTAREAFAWLASRAPLGYRFVWRDAVYLEPDPDLTGPVVAVEAVVAAAVAQGIDLPDTRLATAHVREDLTVGDVACTWAGPFNDVPAAVEAVSAARAELASWLPERLAVIEPRWAPVPVYPGARVPTN